MPLIVATYVCTQPVYNAGRAAHALHSDQNVFKDGMLEIKSKLCILLSRKLFSEAVQLK
jgi:hypothetical protein